MAMHRIGTDLLLELLMIYSHLYLYFGTNSSALGQNGRHFADDISKCIFMNETFCISIQISLKFVPKSPIDN